VRVVGFFCMLLGVAPALAIDVASYDEFALAIADREPSISLTASIAMSGTLVIEHDCTLTASADVTLDMQGNTLLVKAAEFSMGSESHSLTLTGGSPNLLLSSCCVESQHSVFTNCHFEWSVSGNGVDIRGGESLAAEFYRCSANFNEQDGFSTNNFAGQFPSVQLLFSDCNAIGNDPAGLGSPRGDGITTHGYKHVVEIAGGEFFGNSKSGVAIVNQGRLTVRDDAQFADNGWATNIGDVYIERYCILTWWSGYCGLMTLKTEAVLHSGVIDQLNLNRGQIEIYGFEVEGVPAVGYDACLRPIYVGCTEYIAHPLPIPGDTNYTGTLSPSEGWQELVHPAAACDQLPLGRYAVIQRLIRSEIWPEQKQFHPLGGRQLPSIDQQLER
jgi:hypothetical protein